MKGRSGIIGLQTEDEAENYTPVGKGVSSCAEMKTNAVITLISYTTPGRRGLCSSDTKLDTGIRQCRMDGTPTIYKRTSARATLGFYTSSRKGRKMLGPSAAVVHFAVASRQQQKHRKSLTVDKIY